MNLREMEQAIEFAQVENAMRNSWEFAAALMRALPHKMSVELMEAWRNNPKGLQEVLARLNPPAKDPQKLLARPKSVDFGSAKHDHLRKASLLNRLTSAGRDVEEIVKMMIESPTFVLSSEYGTARIITVSNRDLGLPAGAKFHETISKANDLGLEECTPEIAVEYAIVHRTQPLGEEVYVPIERIEVEGFEFPITNVIVSHPDTRGKLLTAFPTYSGERHDGKQRFAFMIRK